MLQFWTDNIAYLLLALDWLIRLGLGVRVVMRRSSVGYTLAWLAVILLVPLLGAIIYLFLGERRLGTRRARRIEELRKPYEEWLEGLSTEFPADDIEFGLAARSLRKQARSFAGIPALPGNQLELLDGAGPFFDRMIEDINAAQSSVHLEYYIWSPTGRVADVVEALKAAARRGVKCRVLIDDVGGMDFWKHESREQLTDCGVQVLPMLEVGVIRSMFSRIDLRNHRKVAVIDGKIAYTGSQNMNDPGVIEGTEDVPNWLDASFRIVGPSVEALQVTFLADFEFETYEGIEKRVSEYDVVRGERSGNAVVQVVPSGPGLFQTTIQELILTAMYGAQHELILTTPYFIPDDSMVKAIISARARGVDVTLVVPRVPDGRIVKLANEAYFEELLESGVRIMRFNQGLLHTKAVTVDGEIALFGTVNLDMRSFYLNYEISLLLYDETSAQTVRQLQQRYIEDSTALDFGRWKNRSRTLRFMQHAAQLLSPLL